MNFVDKLNAEFYKQLGEKQDAKFVRMTCEQIDKTFILDPPHTMGGLAVIKRGSLLDCQLREARPRIPYIDLTKVEPQ